MSSTAIIMMILILSIFFGGFSFMIYRTLTQKNQEN